jgi:hypothetical protein
MPSHGKAEVTVAAATAQQGKVQWAQMTWLIVKGKDVDNEMMQNYMDRRSTTITSLSTKTEVGYQATT